MKKKDGGGSCCCYLITIFIVKFWENIIYNFT